MAAAGLSDWITVWVCAGVGLHFLPLAGVVGDGLLISLGLLITAAAAAALVVGLTTSVAPTTVTGPAAGILLRGDDHLADRRAHRLVRTVGQTLAGRVQPE
jgi:hypothetical protein